MFFIINSCFLSSVFIIMTTKLEIFFAELEHNELLEVVQKINTYMYDVLEAQQNKSGGGKVTKEIMQTIKKCIDQINNRLGRAHKDYVASETRLKTMVTDSRPYDALIEVLQTRSLIKFPSVLCR